MFLFPWLPSLYTPLRLSSFSPIHAATNPRQVQSTLSLLSPFTRALLRIPFLYQRISSTTPTTLLISPTRSTSSSISLIHLDGTTDWLVASRTALLAWTGHGLAPTPRVHSYALGASHWGATLLSGRGLAALAAPAGDTYAVRLAPGEHLVAHPAHVVAYEVTRSRPLPFRLRGKGHAAKDGGGGLSLAVPYVGRLAKYLPAPPGRVTRFVAAMRDTDTYRLVTRFLHGLRTAARRSVYGDALFLRFDGPATLLLSGRAARLGDVLADRQVNELAVARPGEVTAAAEAAIDRVQQEEEEGGAGKGKVEVGKDVVSGMRVASVGKDGKVTLAETKDLNEFVR